MAWMIPLEDYVSQVLETLSPLEGGRVSLGRAHGRMLAEDVTATMPVPPWTNSAMDGYAVRAKDTTDARPQTPVVLPVNEDVPAGATSQPLAKGAAQQIMTGAMLPGDTGAMVKVGDTDQAPGPHPIPERVEIRAAATPGLSARRVGEDVATGDLVMAAGTRPSAAAISALASVELGSALVRPQVRVAVVSTGVELRDASQALGPGTIPDSSSLLLAGLVAEHGAVCMSMIRSGDTAKALAGVPRQAAAGANLIVTSGGMPTGAFDPLTMLVQAQRGEETPVHLDFIKVAMQPGKPQGYGWVLTDDGRRVPIICLPDNSVSVLVSFTTIVTPALARLAGQDADNDGAEPLPGRPVLTARTAMGWWTPSGRRQHIPVRFIEAPTGSGVRSDLDDGVGLPWVTPTRRLGSGSHLVTLLPAAQALAVVAAEVEAVEVGDELSLIPLSASQCPPAVPEGRRDEPRPRRAIPPPVEEPL